MNYTYDPEYGGYHYGDRQFVSEPEFDAWNAAIRSCVDIAREEESQNVAHGGWTAGAIARRIEGLLKIAS